MKITLKASLTLLFTALIISPAFAGQWMEDAPKYRPPQPPEEKPAADQPRRLYLRADYRELDRNTGIGIVVGNVRFIPPGSDTLVAADCGVIWLDRREAYLEGNIRIYRLLVKPGDPQQFNVPRPDLENPKGLGPGESLEKAGDIDSIIEAEVKESVIIDTRFPVSEATKLYVNWAQGTSLLVKPILRMEEADKLVNFVLVAPTAEGIATYRIPVVDADGRLTGKYEERRHFVMKNAYFTTCSFKDPHSRFTTRELDWVEGDYASLHRVVFRAGSTPLFYLPYGWLDFEYDWPSNTVAFGNSSRLGTFISWALTFKITQNIAVTPKIEWFSEAGMAWGLNTKYRFGAYDRTGRTRRDYDIRGMIELYWLQNDQGTDALADVEDDEIRPRWEAIWPVADLGPLPTEEFELGITERYRISWIHQQEFYKRERSNWELDIEYHKFSDANFFREFYDEEYKTYPGLFPPQPRAFLKYRRDNWSAFIHFRTQTNDFWDTTEYLPQVGFNIVAEPLDKYIGKIGQGFLYTQRTEIANVRSEFSKTRRRLGMTQAGIIDYWLDHNEYSVPDPLTLRENDSNGLRTWRLDTMHMVSRPMRYGIFNFEPFGGFRYSWFEHGLSSIRGRYNEETPPVGPPIPVAVGTAPEHTGSVNRTQVLAGLRAATQFFKKYDTADSVFWHRMFPGGMRHIVTPEVAYLYESRPTARPFELPQQDEVSERDGIHKFNFALHNRWQTRRVPELERNPAAPVGGEWYRRKLATELAEQRGPVNVIDLDTDIDLFINPDRDNPDWRGRRSGRFSNLRNDLTFRPNERTTIFFDTEFNFDQAGGSAGGFEVITGGIKYQPNDTFFISFSHQYFLHDVSLVRLALGWEINPKWAIGFDIGYDFADSDWWDKSLHITRRWHEWEVTFSYEFDIGKAETIGIVNIGPSRRSFYQPSWRFQPRSIEAFRVVETAR